MSGVESAASTSPSAGNSSLISRAYRPDIDGLRALAVTGVVITHAGFPILIGGFTGVDIFFVISGYLIGGHIFSEICSGTFSFLSFYQRRAKRILPAFYVVLGFCVVVSLLLLSAGEEKLFAQSGCAAVLSLSNCFFWHSAAGYFKPTASFQPLLMTWSLGVEEQFYVVIPLLLVLLSRVRRSLLLPAILTISVLSFSLACFDLIHFPRNAFYLLPDRAWELGVGVALAIMESTRGPASLRPALATSAGVLGSALMIVPMFLLTGGASLFPGPGAVPSVVGTALVIAVANAWTNRRIWSFPPLVFIGRISYSWYLWHWPVLAFLRVCDGEALPRLTALTAIALSFALAVASYYLIEQPFRRSSCAPAPLLLRYASFSAALLALTAGLWLAGGVPARYPSLVAVDRAVAETSSDPCLVSHGDAPLISSHCEVGSRSGVSVVVWGDSHAGALAPALREIALRQGYGFDEYVHTGCAPTVGGSTYRPDKSYALQECNIFSQATLAKILSDPSARIVVLAGRWTDFFSRESQESGFAEAGTSRAIPYSLDGARNFLRDALTATIKPLVASRRHVIVVGDVPNFGFEPPERVRTWEIPARRLVSLWSTSQHLPKFGSAAAAILPGADEARQALDEATAGRTDVQLLSVTPAFCFGSAACSYFSDGKLLYSDEQHLTPDGARFAMRDFRFPSASGPASD